MLDMSVCTRAVMRMRSASAEIHYLLNHTVILSTKPKRALNNEQTSLYEPPHTFLQHSKQDSKHRDSAAL